MQRTELLQLGMQENKFKTISEGTVLAERVKDGLLLMGWGFFQKLVIADRISILVADVYNNFSDYSGAQILLSTVFFAFQIYCDFGGYSDIAVGAARVMGFTLTKNFKNPYYATTVSEFWRSWQISLSTWFRDYVYIPLEGNRCGRLKKYRNILLTFLFVDIAWFFFRCDGMANALAMLRHCVSDPGFFALFSPDNLLGIGTMALSEKNFYVMLLSLVLFMLVDYLKKRGVDFKGMLARQNLWFRWLVYYGLIFTILILGVYGPEYDASAFIYFQF